MYLLLMVKSVGLLALLLLVANSSLAGVTTKTFAECARQAEEARKAERLTEALALYSEAVRIRPSWADGWWWQGSILYDQDRFAEAQVPLKRFIALSPKPAPAYAFLGLCEYETGDYGSALGHFEAWAKGGTPGNDALLDVAGYRFALVLLHESRFNAAMYLLAAKAKKLGPTPEIVEAMGLASLRIPLLPETYPPYRREAVWLAGTAAYFSIQEDISRSRTYAARLLQRYGTEPNVHYFRGTLFAFQQDRDAAAREYLDELRISPDHTPALTELAFIHLEALQPHEALAPARRAVALDAQSARAHYVLGRALSETGEYREAANELEIAKRLAPESSRIRFVLANAYQQLGRHADSKREQAAFLALKDKEQVLAPLDEKLKRTAEPSREP